MLDWWKLLTLKQQIAMIVAIFGAIGGISIALNIDINTGDTRTQTINGGDIVAHHSDDNINTDNSCIQNQTINTGITLAQHEQWLKQREAENRDKLEKVHKEDRKLLEAQLNDIQQALQDTTASYDALVADLQERIAHLEAQQNEWLRVLLDQAIEALQKGDINSADHLFEQTTKTAEKMAAEGYFQRGKIAEDDYRYVDAIQFYENSVHLQTDGSDSWLLLGNLYFRTGKFEKAENAYKTVLSLAGTDYTWQQASAYRGLGFLYRMRGELDKAVKYHEKALTINQELNRKEGIAKQYVNLGLVYYTRGELNKAVDFYEKSLAIEQVLGRKKGLANTYGNLGLVYRTRGELDKAVEFHEKALTINQELGRRDGMARQYGNLGLVYYTRGELDKAVEFYEKSMAVNRELGRKEGIAKQYGNLGDVYETHNNLDKAIEFYEKSLAINQEIGRKEGIANQYTNLGNVYQIRGELDKAVEYWKQALIFFTEVGATREIEQVQILLDGVEQ